MIFFGVNITPQTINGTSSAGFINAAIEPHHNIAHLT
jgi:hypothetical protein